MDTFLLHWIRCLYSIKDWITCIYMKLDTFIVFGFGKLCGIRDLILGIAFVILEIGFICNTRYRIRIRHLNFMWPVFTSLLAWIILVFSDFDKWKILKTTMKGLLRDRWVVKAMEDESVESFLYKRFGGSREVNNTRS